MRYFFYILVFSLLPTLSNTWAEEGDIWHVAEQRFISEKSLISSLSLSKNILLGIRSDNPSHYRYAARIIEELTRSGRKPVILVSSVERSKQNAFAIFSQRHQDSDREYDATGLDMLLDWSQSGQPDWAIVRPLFDMAIAKKFPLKAVNFSRHEIGQLHLNGLAGLPEDLKPDLHSLLTLARKGHTTARITKEISQEYCETLPPKILEKFTLIRHARESLFALNMAATDSNTVVLVTRQKHVAKRTGTPRFLKEMNGAGESVSLSFVETGQDFRDKDVDFIWTTAKVSRPLPCQPHSTN